MPRRDGKETMRNRLCSMLLLAASSIGLAGCVVAEAPPPPPTYSYGYGYYGRPYAYAPPRYYAPPPPRYYRYGYGYGRPYYRY